MPLALNDIRANAQRFAAEWRGEKSERAEAQSFWNEFFEVFGLKRRRVAVFERGVARLKYGAGRIDVFWPGVMLAEHKSAGADLDAAFTQASDYFAGLADAELPQYVVVSDFQRIRVYDLDDHARPQEFKLAELPRRIHLFGFISGYRKQPVREQDPINVDAVARMGDLHDLLKRDGYRGHALEVFLVRLLFCFFADDTGIFQPRDSFHDLIETFTREDGADVGDVFNRLFETLNTDAPERQKSLPEHFAQFPYVNGRLFEERLTPPVFDRAMRATLLKLAELNWGAISPAIFGAMFQAVIDHDARELRRQMGAHYTSEANILKLIGPLFLDELRAEFERVRGHKDKLFEFWKKLARLNFLDPACGCGNFLVIAYRELRRLELDVLRAAEKFGQRIGEVFALLKVDVDQFHGIEIEEFPAQVAQVAMWLMDHQMNLEAGALLGEPVSRIPLRKSANVRLGNALRIDWAEFVPPARLHYILGNPPFIGKPYQTAAQKEDLQFVTQGIKSAGVLDYVAGWYIKAAHYLTDEPGGFGAVATKASRDRKAHRDMRFGGSGPALADLFVEADEAEVRARRAVRCAFVSTNSVTQGEQVGVLWGWLAQRGVRIQFAHRTFKWSNEAPGKAAVHCVIVGFGLDDPPRKRLFEYAEVDGPPHEVAAQNINAYLVDAPNFVLPNRATPVCPVPVITYGSKPADGGHLLLSQEERDALVAAEPPAEEFVRPFLNADEFLYGTPRYCLWLVTCPPRTLLAMPLVRKRVDAVKAMRLASPKVKTREQAKTPTLFAEIRQPTSDYLLVPAHTSETRSFVPLGYVPASVVCGNANFAIPNATPLHFGILSSTMHNAWIRFVCGRLESRYRYSAGIVYNNFPWPAPIDAERHADDKSARLRAAIEVAAQGVLDARAAHPGESLATLYNPESMPPALTQAHAKLDRAVDAAYVPDGGQRTWASDAERVAFLFKRHQALASLLPAA
ncbi:MAG: DNA methyltransferase [Betaproteobacteria bacterium]